MSLRRKSEKVDVSSPLEEARAMLERQQAVLSAANQGWLSPEELIETPKPLSITKRTECVVGVRRWGLARMYPDGWLLQSLNGGVVVGGGYSLSRFFSGSIPPPPPMPARQGGSGPFWYPRKRMEAACTQGHSHTAPADHCQCGLYAVMSPAEAPAVNEIPCIMGEVYLWGRVVEHANGYRAQYGYPKRLSIFNVGYEPEVLRASLEASYGVSVDVWS